jgi:hypothetical protein
MFDTPPTLRRWYLDLGMYLVDFKRAYLESIDSTFVNRPWCWIKYNTIALWVRHG